jgi:hypothetical protein
MSFVLKNIMPLFSIFLFLFSFVFNKIIYKATCPSGLRGEIQDLLEEAPSCVQIAQLPNFYSQKQKNFTQIGSFYFADKDQPALIVILRK